MAKVAIVGATGLVGSTLLNLLEERDINVDEVILLASARSKGKEIPFKGETLIVQELTEEVAKEGIDYVLMSAGGSISLKFLQFLKNTGQLSSITRVLGAWILKLT